MTEPRDKSCVSCVLAHCVCLCSSFSHYFVEELFISFWCVDFVGVSTPEIPGPTSKLSLRAPAQMGRRETEHKEGKTAALCCPAPRVDALVVGGYKRSRGREREPVRQPVLPRGHLFVRGP
jgi:hypothetical protein